MGASARQYKDQLQYKLRHINSTDRHLKPTYSYRILLWKWFKLSFVWTTFYLFFLFIGLIRFFSLHGKLQLKCVILKILILTNNDEPSKIGVISDTAPGMKDIIAVDHVKTYKFLWQRAYLYIEPMTWGLAKYLADYVVGEQNFKIISDRDLQFVLVSCVMALNIHFDEDDWISISFHGFRRYKLHEGFYACAREVKMKKDYSKMVVKMFNYESQQIDTYYWDENEKPSDDWKLVKLHLQQAIMIQSAGRSHTYVHFMLPNSASVALDAVELPKTSVLRGLLEPHFTHTEAINYMALHIGNSSNNTNTFWNRLFFLWQPFPMAMEQFIGEIARRTFKFYYNTGFETTPTFDETKVVHFAPPKFIQHDEYNKLPYYYFL